jgi:hypothetical protein
MFGRFAVKSLLMVAVGAFFVSLAPPAMAQAMPRYDVEAYCRTVADVSGGSEMIFGGCMEIEQDAYDARKAGWSSLPGKSRDYCDEVARVSGGSYAILDGCLELETDAAASTPTFKY